MPSYTFVATAVAALNAGYTPYFVDMNPDTFALDPGNLISHPALERTGTVVVVAPYGKPVDASKWRTFLQESGVPVVIDAAAGFDAIASRQLAVTAEVPVALSFHATTSVQERAAQSSVAMQSLCDAAVEYLISACSATVDRS